MTRKKALERWETKLGNAEVTPQVIWPIVKSLLTRHGPRAPTAIHDASGLKFLPSEKAKAVADSLKLSSHHMSCLTKTMNGRWRLKFKPY
jgi:hypothetical protein